MSGVRIFHKCQKDMKKFKFKDLILFLLNDLVCLVLYKITLPQKLAVNYAIFENHYHSFHHCPHVLSKVIKNYDSIASIKLFQKHIRLKLNIN